MLLRIERVVKFSTKVRPHENLRKFKCSRVFLPMSKAFLAFFSVNDAASFRTFKQSKIIIDLIFRIYVLFYCIAQNK